ncbi:MAG: AAA family ATPase [Planctomycetota bacterium]|jgi:MoxR-like ATPase
MTTATAEEQALIGKVRDAYRATREELSRKIVGQDEVLEQLLTALFSGGHCLLIGVPGLAKTLMIRSVSELLDLKFKRIQFTPDLMPSDITGTEVIGEDPETGERGFRFIRGPIFSNLILADEINRSTPKTQAALMEAMEEFQVTIGGERHVLEQPFFVLATQNPIEQEGTYPLPTAQLDRFMFNIQVDYPGFEEERKIILRTTSNYDAELGILLSNEEIKEAIALVRRMPIPDDIMHYATHFARFTRTKDPDAPDFTKEWVKWGASPRAAQALIFGAKARTILDGRTTPTHADVRALVYPVLRHRIITSFHADAEGVTSDTIVKKLINFIPAPDFEPMPEKKQNAFLDWIINFFRKEK